MKTIHKILIPLTIVIASIILGSFYYLSEAKKQNSIQQRQDSITSEKATCANEAERWAVLKEKESYDACIETKIRCLPGDKDVACIFGCDDYKEGFYSAKNYEMYNTSCLQSKGL